MTTPIKRHGILTHESNEYIEKIYKLFAVLKITDYNEQDELIESLKRWQQSTIWSPIQSVDICINRALCRWKMPWID